MIKFRDTPEYDAFIASADSRNTSPEIMKAIGFFSRDLAEAEALWENGYSPAATLLDIWEHVTGNGLRDASEYYWGAAENHWAAYAAEMASA